MKREKDILKDDSLEYLLDNLSISKTDIIKHTKRNNQLKKILLPLITLLLSLTLLIMVFFLVNDSGDNEHIKSIKTENSMLKEQNQRLLLENERLNLIEKSNSVSKPPEETLESISLSKNQKIFFITNSVIRNTETIYNPINALRSNNQNGTYYPVVLQNLTVKIDDTRVIENKIIAIKKGATILSNDKQILLNINDQILFTELDKVTRVGSNYTFELKAFIK